MAAGKLIALDTTILIELLKRRKRQALSDDDVMRLLDLQHTYVVPTLTLGEALAGFPRKQAREHLVDIERTFQLATCDTEAAKLASDIHNVMLKSRSKDRKCTKLDVFIAATAKAHGCDGLVSLDEKDMPKIALALDLQYYTVVDLVGPQLTLPRLPDAESAASE